ncbi:Hsp70 family protein [Phytomonospora endophytica]|uniref:Ethanolamine utilization protein EutJ (Predicted chaperonin) n=1 Tax=Phytomonospora endophytica TaxID=714109 RepID=A0A841FN55_9ACTN|nr:Hsp70 family protein [Phytomonospora endophytica]MBB6037536.1 Ethanolamine utilization protein EutJ (predicted chaperonin) [Phytomonospora endophytica]GIG70237.1 hypothetical protein Pen01_65320 [Phytomonospora endophytica]
MGGFRLSVDYGTSHTVAVLAEPGGRTRPLLFDGSPLLPSTVAAHDGHLLTGAEALRAARTTPAATEPNPKRRITDGDVLLGGRSYPVTALIAATFRTVSDEARRVAGHRPALTVTHPAGWGASRRGVLAAAVASAGYDTAAYVPEPVAAARFFTARSGVPVGAHLVVYDLGAGTCDVAVLRRTGDGFDVVGVGGLDDVGGLDLDAVVVDVLGRAVGATGEWRRLLAGDRPRDRHALWQEAREAKEALSRRASALVHVLGRDLPVSREDFEAASRPVLDRTVALTGQVIASAGLTNTDVSAVYLVGGASRVPLVATLLHRATGIAPTVLDQPELVVAEGAVLGTGPARAETPPPDENPTPDPRPAPPPKPPAPAPAPAPAPPAASLFDFTPPPGLVARSQLGAGVAVVLFLLPIAITLIPGLRTAVMNDLLRTELGLDPPGDVIAVFSPWLLCLLVQQLTPNGSGKSRVRVDDESITVVRGDKPEKYLWEHVNSFGTEKDRLVLHALSPAPGGSGFVPKKLVLGDPAWLPSGGRGFAAVVERRSGGRFRPL